MCSMLMALDPNAIEEEASSCIGTFLVAESSLRSCSFTARQPGCSIEDLQDMLALALRPETSLHRVQEHEVMRSKPVSDRSTGFFTGVSEQVRAMQAPASAVQSVVWGKPWCMP